MKRQIGGKDMADLAAPQRLANRPHGGFVAIAQIDGQEAAGRFGGAHGAGGLDRGAAQRFLAEDRSAALQRRDRLIDMHRTGRGDHDAVRSQRQQVVQCRAARGIGGQGARGGEAIRGRIGQRHDLGRPRIGDGLHPVSPDPAEAEKAQSRAGAASSVGMWSANCCNTVMTCASTMP